MTPKECVRCNPILFYIFFVDFAMDLENFHEIQIS